MWIQAQYYRMILDWMTDIRKNNSRVTPNYWTSLANDNPCNNEKAIMLEENVYI